MGGGLVWWLWKKFEGVLHIPEVESPTSGTKNSCFIFIMTNAFFYESFLREISGFQSTIVWRISEAIFSDRGVILHFEGPTDLCMVSIGRPRGEEVQAHLIKSGS